MSGFQSIRSCLQCRQHKRRCDRELPCRECNIKGRDCAYTAPSQVFVIVGADRNDFQAADARPSVPIPEDVMMSADQCSPLVQGDVRTSSTNHSRPGRTDMSAPQSAPGPYSCQNRPQQDASCSICIALAGDDKLNIRQSATTVPGHHCTRHRGLGATPMHSVPQLSSVDPREHMALQYFQSVVAKDVSGFISTGFWEILVPQMCEMEYTAKQVAIALSQAHRERATMILAQQQTFFQRKYGSPFSAASELRANRALRKYIETSPSPSYELVLTCSIMLHTLESMYRREASAILHIENALKMFKAWQAVAKQIGSRRKETAVRYLTTVLARLDLSLTIASEGKRTSVFEHDHRISSVSSDESLVLDLSFTDPHDAYYQLGRITTPAAMFLIQNRSWSGKKASSMPKETLEEQRMHLTRFRAFETAMGRYELKRLRHNGVGDMRAETLYVLASRIVHWSAERLVEEFVRDDHNKCPWDQTSQKLLVFCSDAISYIEEARLADDYLGHTSFSPEVAVCSFLLMLAGRTTLSDIRYKALALAQRFDRKEGVRDLVRTFLKWISLPHPRPSFQLFLGTEGTERTFDVVWCITGLGLQAVSWA